MKTSKQSAKDEEPTNVKVAVEFLVEGKNEQFAYLGEFGLKRPLEENIEIMCDFWGLKKPEQYALQFSDETRHYVTEENRSRIKAGSVLSLVWSPSKLAECILNTLKESTSNDKLSAVKRLADMTSDSTFVETFLSLELPGAMDLIDAAQLQGARNINKFVKPASVGAIWVTLFITLTLTLGLGVYMTLALRGSCACRILERCSAASDVTVGATLSTAQGIPCPELPRTCPEAPGSYQGRGGVSRSSRDTPMNHPSSSPRSRMRLCDNATTRGYLADDDIGYESRVERRNSSLTLMETTSLIDSIFPDGFGSQNTPDNNNVANPLYEAPRTRESLFSRETTLLSVKPGTSTAGRTKRETEDVTINEGEGEHLYEDMEAVRPSAFVPTGIHDDDTIIFKKAPRHASPRKVRRVTFTLGETTDKE